MKRRVFLGAGLAGAAALGAQAQEQERQRTGGRGRGPRRDYYEWRTYTLASAEQQALVEAWLEKAAIPALNRLGVERVGVFTELEPSETRRLHVLVVYPSMREFAAVARGALFEDAVYRDAGADYLQTPKEAPAYERFESGLMLAFENMPRLRAPEKKDRIFELRVYESHNETKAKKKIEMFNSAEIALFDKTGLTTVFFGESLVGTRLPNLAYLLVFDDMADHDADWKSFIDSPEWNELKDREEYRDTVSHITKTFLAPAPCSQV